MFEIILFLFPFAYSPGPGNLFFATMGARYGFGKTIPANTGYHIATWLVTFAIGVGFGQIFEVFPQVFDVVKIFGALYIFYLAVKVARTPAAQFATQVNPVGFWSGAVLMVLNPKAYVIIILLLAQFLPAGPKADMWNLILIVTVFTLNNLVAFSLYTASGARLFQLFGTGSNQVWMNRGFGILLAAVGLWILIA